MIALLLSGCHILTKLIQQWQNSNINLIISKNQIEKIWSILYWPLKTFDKASGVYLQPSTFKSQCGVCFRVGKLSILSCSKELMHGYSVIACLASKARVVRVSSSDLEAEIRQYGSVLRVRGKLQTKIWTNKNFKQIRTKFANKNIYHKNDKRSREKDRNQNCVLHHANENWEKYF